MKTLQEVKKEGLSCVECPLLDTECLYACEDSDKIEVKTNEPDE
jgi:hypothetical protein